MLAAGRSVVLRPYLADEAGAEHDEVVAQLAHLGVTHWIHIT